MNPTVTELIIAKQMKFGGVTVVVTAVWVNEMMVKKNSEHK
jgi:hypothetical protein